MLIALAPAAGIAVPGGMMMTPPPLPPSPVLTPTVPTVTWTDTDATGATGPMTGNNCGWISGNAMPAGAVLKPEVTRPVELA